MEISEASLSTKYGTFKVFCFRFTENGKEQFALVKDIVKDSEPLVRIHSECLTGDVFSSRKCDCGDQLSAAMSMIAKNGGMIIYLRQEGRGIGLLNKIRAYSLQEKGIDTVEANLLLGRKIDERDYSEAVKILNFFKIKAVRLITNNPQKISTLETSGIFVKERIPCIAEQTPENSAYLITKKKKMNHLL